MGRQYVGENAVAYLINLIKSGLEKKIDRSDIVNNLTSTESDKPLSAAQGKILSDSMEKKINVSDIVNNTSTDDTKKPLSAAQGKKIWDALEKKADSSAVSDPETYVNSQKGIANGLTPLGEDKKVPAEYLPSYVDDVIEGYLYDNVFYVDKDHHQSIQGERGKIYVDLSEGTPGSYRWTSGGYISIVSSDMVEIDSDEIQQMWDQIS